MMTIMKSDTVVKRICVRTKKKDILSSAAAFLLSLLIGGIIIALSGNSPAEAYGALFRGAFGDGDALANTLAKATPLIFTGLAVAISMDGGLLNIGGEGQLYMGGFIAAICGIYLKGLPKMLLVPLCLLCAGIGGGLVAAAAGFLKARRNINEVIVTIMLNYIVIDLTDYLVSYPFKAEGMVSKTADVSASAMLTQLLPNTNLTSGIIIAVLFAVLVYLMIGNTVTGFEIRAMGYNGYAAETGGVNLKSRIVLTMFISGFVAAIAGAVEVLGVHRYFIKGFSPGYGFDGMAVAVLAKNDPFGIVVAAVLFGALRSGGMLLDRSTSIPGDFVVIIQALVIIFVATPGIVKSLRLRRGGKKFEKQHN